MKKKSDKFERGQNKLLETPQDVEHKLEIAKKRARTRRSI